MKMLFLALCLWPFCHKAHVETFAVTISSDGTTMQKFKRSFSASPVCTRTRGGTGLEWYTDRVVVHGKPGDVVTGACK